ncbi:hypothetical protein VT03_06535 [Planctomyces sp. SH-PL14]|nr:hypothetical protein VT03_06535 [Planctomyces sp. SH-PL14]
MRCVFGRSCCCVALLLAAAGPLWAHPGHGTTDPGSVAHIAEPVHCGAIFAAVAAVAVAGIVVWSFRKARSQRR